MTDCENNIQRNQQGWSRISPNTIWEEHLISGCSLCVSRPSVWKPASVHEIRMTLNRVPFSTSQIKVYWRPKWEGKVAMATSVKRASDLTRNQSINLWFLSCLIKKVCMWLIANFWEYRNAAGLLAASRLKGSYKRFATSKTWPRALLQELTQLCEVIEKSFYEMKTGGKKTLENPCESADDLLPSQIPFMSKRVTTMRLRGIQSPWH